MFVIETTYSGGNDLYWITREEVIVMNVVKEIIDNETRLVSEGSAYSCTIISLSIFITITFSLCYLVKIISRYLINEYLFIMTMLIRETEMVKLKCAPQSMHQLAM